MLRTVIITLKNDQIKLSLPDNLPGNGSTELSQLLFLPVIVYRHPSTGIKRFQMAVLLITSIFLGYLMFI